MQKVLKLERVWMSIEIDMEENNVMKPVGLTVADQIHH